MKPEFTLNKFKLLRDVNHSLPIRGVYLRASSMLHTGTSSQCVRKHGAVKSTSRSPAIGLICIEIEQTKTVCDSRINEHSNAVDFTCPLSNK